MKKNVGDKNPESCQVGIAVGAWYDATFAVTQNIYFTLTHTNMSGPFQAAVHF